MLQGTIVENSLRDAAVLKDLKILKSWEEGTWRLHEAQVNREEALGLAKHLADGPWYMHFWQPGKDDILVVFKDKIFDIKHSDKSTWQEAIAHGQSIGIPEPQLDFVIE